MKNYKLISLIVLSLIAVLACERKEPVLTKEEEVIYPEIPPPDVACIGPGCTLKDYHDIDDSACWSNDGKWIAYIHRDLNPVKTGIYIISADGKENHFILTAKTAISSLSWANDDKSIWYGSGTQFCNVTISDKQIRTISLAGKTYEPKVSANGQWIAYQRSYSSPEPITVMGIWRIKTDGSGNEQVYSGNSGYPFWANNELNFLRGSVDTVGHRVGDSLFFYNELKKEAERKLYVSPNMIYGSFSPAANKYVYTSQAVGFMPEIWIMNADASEKIRLKVQGFKGDISKDGKYIAYTDTRRINGRLWVMDADGGNQRQLTFYEQFK